MKTKKPRAPKDKTWWGSISEKEKCELLSRPLSKSLTFTPDVPLDVAIRQIKEHQISEAKG